MKKLALFLICFSTLAVAQNSAVYGTSGRAILASSNTQRAEVRFEVVGSPTSTAIRGFLDFRTIVTSVTQRVHAVSLVRANRLAVDGHTAEFAGDAVLYMRSNTGVTTVRGALVVRVDDLRNPTSPGTARDRFSMRFISPTVNFSYAFDGVAVEGDLRVFDRR
ncbi:MAG TPA: hypothetical protein PLL78_00280 [Fimbriimonadaceae bacterium]|nr:hypothetical protein [Fimbriimonadaceae bacterium]HRJ95097.1 hypothetical protein [Fimbriimonadaceae bacterium]